MNDTTKRYLLSSLTTFIVAFIGSISIMLQSGSIEWTAAFWASLMLVGARGGVKALVEGLAGTHAD